MVRIPAARTVSRRSSFSLPRPPRASTRRPTPPEPGSVEAIAKFTTEPRFLSPWVSYVPASATVPSPTKYLGHVAGAAGELSRTSQVYGYLRELAKATPRVKVDVIGKSEEGRDILLVAIADEEGIRSLDRLKAATAALADPRKTHARSRPRRSSRRPGRSTTSTPASTRPRPAAPRWSWSSPTASRSPSSR